MAFIKARIDLSMLGHQMASLADFRFTTKDDFAASSDGWLVPASTSINSKTGDDVISGSSPNAIAGIDVSENGSIFTKQGSDAVIGASTAGYGIANNGTIDTGAGDDDVRGEGRFGIFNGGLIITGVGNDSVTGVCGVGGLREAIRNNGTIDTGNGDDMITGVGSLINPSIINDGIIDTGEGADTVDGFSGGFWGAGKVFLGKGADTLVGICTLGTISFDGGKGLDRILLDRNRIYYIDNAQNGALYIRDPQVLSSEGTYINFELVGGLGGSELAPLRAGTLAFDASANPIYL
jgi:hypothetical protein